MEMLPSRFLDSCIVLKIRLQVHNLVRDRLRTGHFFRFLDNLGEIYAILEIVKAIKVVLLELLFDNTFSRPLEGHFIYGWPSLISRLRAQSVLKEGVLTTVTAAGPD